MTIRKELLFLFAIKILLLFGLWWVCFSKPINPYTMPANTARHLFNISLDKTHD